MLLQRCEISSDLIDSYLEDHKMANRLKPTKRNRLTIFWVGLGAFVLIVGAVWLKTNLISRDKNNSSTVESTASVSSLSTLLALPVAELTRMDIARMNLLCAQGLPGADDLERGQSGVFTQVRLFGRVWSCPARCALNIPARSTM